MQEDTREDGAGAFEARSRALFLDSVERLDMATRSRLTRARSAALDVHASTPERPWLRRWAPAAGMAAAAVLGVALWFGSPTPVRGPTGADPATLDDLDIVAVSADGSADGIDLLQNDLDFYDFADKAAANGPAV